MSDNGTLGQGFSHGGFDNAARPRLNQRTKSGDTDASTFVTDSPGTVDRVPAVRPSTPRSSASATPRVSTVQ